MTRSLLFYHLNHSRDTVINVSMFLHNYWCNLLDEISASQHLDFFHFVLSFFHVVDTVSEWCTVISFVCSCSNNCYRSLLKFICITVTHWLVLNIVVLNLFHYQDWICQKFHQSPQPSFFSTEIWVIVDYLGFFVAALVISSAILFATKLLVFLKLNVLSSFFNPLDCKNTSKLTTC